MYTTVAVPRWFLPHAVKPGVLVPSGTELDSLPAELAMGLLEGSKPGWARCADVGPRWATR